MIDDEKIIEMFFERSEQGIRELDIKYGKVFHNLSYHIVGSRRDAEECVNDAYLGAWNAIPPARPMAACLCLVIVGAFALPRFIGNDTPDTPPAIEENAYCSNAGHRKNFCIYPCKRRALQNRANW